jgi:hypothetical protein
MDNKNYLFLYSKSGVMPQENAEYKKMTSPHADHTGGENTRFYPPPPMNRLSARPVTRATSESVAK